MNVTKIDICDGAYINLRDGYYKVLVIEKKINFLGFLRKTVTNENIKHVVIDGAFDNSIFDELKDILSINFMYNEKFCDDNFYKLNKLKRISISDSYKFLIDFAKFISVQEIDIPWNEYLKFTDTNNLRYLILRKYKKETFEIDLPKNIEFLELIQGKLKSIQGIEKYTSLKALVIFGHQKMEEYDSISKLQNLEFLHLHGGKLKNVAFITKLKNLKWLVLENCKEVETLKPLLSLEKLEGVHLVGATKVLDGDKSIRDIKRNIEYCYPYTTVGQRLYKDL